VVIGFFTSSSLAEQLGISFKMAILASPMRDKCKKVLCPTDALGKLAKIIQPDWDLIKYDHS